MRLSSTLVSVLSLAAPVASQYAELPETRYTQWLTLSSENAAAAMSIGYDESSWDFLYENEIELLAFSDIEVDGFAEAMETMGIDEDQ